MGRLQGSSANRPAKGHVNKVESRLTHDVKFLRKKDDISRVRIDFLVLTL